MNREIVKAALVFMLVGLVLGGIIGYGLFGRGKATDYVNERDMTTFVDTIPYYKPVPKDSAVVRYVTRVLPVKGRDNITTYGEQDTFFAEKYAQNTEKNIPQVGNNEVNNIPAVAKAADSDSIEVEIPITQKRYENEDYRAWVSGYEPSLDSIYVFPKTTVIHERSYKPPNKWHIGITGGYGYGFKSKQVEPYIGIGISYSLISF